MGAEIPAVELRGLTGAEGTLGRDDLRGHVVLINFWATWCPPCLAELPHMAELAHRLESHGDFRFVSVSTGEAASEAEFEDLRQKTEAILADLGLTISTYADPRDVTFGQINQLGTPGGPAVPTTVLLDRQGIIRSVWVGYRPGLEQEMEERVRELLGQ